MGSSSGAAPQKPVSSKGHGIVVSQDNPPPGALLCKAGCFFELHRQWRNQREPEQQPCCLSRSVLKCDTFPALSLLTF
jgi:hypothetical protein